MAPANAHDTSFRGAVKPVPALPRVRPVVPLVSHRQRPKPSADGLATPDKSDASDAAPSTQSSAVAQPLTPDSARSPALPAARDLAVTPSETEHSKSSPVQLASSPPSTSEPSHSVAEAAPFSAPAVAQPVPPPQDIPNTVLYHSDPQPYYSMPIEPQSTVTYYPPPPPFAYGPSYGPQPMPAGAWYGSDMMYPPPGIHPSGPPQGTYTYGPVLSRSGSGSSSANDPLISAGLPPKHAPPMYVPPVLPGDYDLLDHVRSNFGVAAFADYTLDILSADPTQSRVTTFPAHALMMARNPTLYDLMQAQDPQRGEDGLKKLTIVLENKYMTPAALGEAMGVVYGHPPPNVDGAMFSDDFRTTSFGIAYALAGKYLQLPLVVDHGLELAARYLSWNDVEKALVFALDPNSTNTGRIKEPLGAQDLQDVMLNRVLNFVAAEFPLDFAFLISAPELSSLPRIPSIVESRPSISSSLADIQFGAIPRDTSASLASNLLVSSILLSVPTHFLQRLSGNQLLGSRLGWEKAANILVDVVDEREARRLKVLRSKRIIPGASREQWEETKWEEAVVSSVESPSGIVVERRIAEDD